MEAWLQAALAIGVLQHHINTAMEDDGSGRMNEMMMSYMIHST